MSETLINVNNLTKIFQSRMHKQPLIAVNDVTIDIKKGHTVGLVGESGSGKSTIGRCLLRLIEIDNGEIIFEGQRLDKLKKDDFRKKMRSRMQMVFQDPYDSLNPRKKIKNIVLEPIRLAGKMNGRDPDLVAGELLEKVRLNPSLINSYRHQLTPGQQQCVGIARAIATNPDFIVLDEPTSLLDVSVRMNVLQILADLQKTLGITYLFISHDLSTVQVICHDVAVMYLGKIIETGTVNQVFNTPRHPYSKALLSSVLLPDPSKKHLSCELKGEIPSPLDMPSGCPLHTRCPSAVPECIHSKQQMQDIGEGHIVACMRVVNGEI
ncbi:MAG: ABC transporter ATP-binding protein [Eubacterium sp.]|jgi:oligopeptide/dipeptide ABC transporter ATP-binding protein|nr:ABC transporter ATP-binding protein [Eubacterium sp.]